MTLNGEGGEGNAGGFACGNGEGGRSELCQVREERGTLRNENHALRKLLEKSLAFAEYKPAEVWASLRVLSTSILDRGTNGEGNGYLGYMPEKTNKPEAEGWEKELKEGPSEDWVPTHPDEVEEETGQQ